MSLDWPVILAWVFGGGLLGTVVKLILVVPESRKLKADAGKTGADAAAVLSNSAVALLGPMNEQVAEMGRDLREARDEVREVRAENRALKTELEETRADAQSAKHEVAQLRGLIAEMSHELDQLRKQVTPEPGGAL